MEPEEAVRAAQEPLAAPIRLEGGRPRPVAWLRLAAFLVALAGHAAVLLCLTRQPLDLRVGSHGDRMASADVTMIDSKVLEARRAPEQPAVAAATKMADAKEGVLDGKEAASAAADADRPKKMPAHVQRPDELAAPAEEITKPQQLPEEKRTKASDAKPLGGLSARSDTAAADQAAPAAASPGVARAYAAAVAEALNRTRLKRVPAYGTVRVKLVVSTGGEVDSVEILESSGNRRLDDAVLAQLRRAKLPVPPPGLSIKERWFEFPYQYVR
jgi:protein TonB